MKNFRTLKILFLILYFIDSPQVAQVYVHKSRIPHPQYPDASARYYEQVPVRPPLLAEPPPAHHRSQALAVSYPQQQSSPALPTNLTSHIQLQQQQQQHQQQQIHEKEREQREREQQQLRIRERERTSIPGMLRFYYTFTHSILLYVSIFLKNL